MLRFASNWSSTKTFVTPELVTYRLARKQHSDKLFVTKSNEISVAVGWMTNNNANNAWKIKHLDNTKIMRP